MIGTLDMLVIDCPDARALAGFYAELLGADIVDLDDDWAEIVAPGISGPVIAFQQVQEFTPPKWPGQVVPQQMHLDVKVEDFEAAEEAVLALGAKKTGSGTATYRVYLDPVGHPFCLIKPND